MRGGIKGCLAPAQNEVPACRVAHTPNSVNKKEETICRQSPYPEQLEGECHQPKLEVGLVQVRGYFHGPSGTPIAPGYTFQGQWRHGGRVIVKKGDESPPI